MKTHGLFLGLISIVLAFAPTFVGAGEPVAPGTILQYGKMHEAIGQQQHQGRVRLSELLARPHFFAVAALEGLRGEITIYDGQLTVTTVGPDGRLQASEYRTGHDQATMLVGAYVPSWKEYPVPAEVGVEEFDAFIAEAAMEAGLRIDEPFPFAIEGGFRDVRLHVIRGACPIRARLKKQQIPPEKQPFESEMPEATGKVVGVFAKDAVGDLTHPATSTHVHLLFNDPSSGATVTGHLEQIGIRVGAVLRLPAGY